MQISPRRSSRQFAVAFALTLLSSISAFVPSTTSIAAQQKRQSTVVVHAGSTNPAAGELTNQLARLDRQWKLQQRRQERSRWTKIILNLDRVREIRAGLGQGRRDDEFVYLLEPPYRTIPSCIIVFTGGAGLGTYPQVAYNEFLLRIANRLNAAVITAPYPVGLDHAELARKNGDLLQRAVRHCQRSRLYPHDIPIYSLAHSLGSKLSFVYSATQQQNYAGHGYISFNNFGFDQTFTMAKKFGETFRLNTGLSRNMEHEMLVDGFFTFAEKLVRVSRMEFSPSPDQTMRLVEHRLTDEQRKKTRLFTFDEDNMDSTREFFHASGSKRPPQISSLPGTHLTPVYFQLGLDGPRSSQTKGMGGFHTSASFGREQDLQTLVDEVCLWIHGQGPTREPSWMPRRIVRPRKTVERDFQETR